MTMPDLMMNVQTCITDDTTNPCSMSDHYVWFNDECKTCFTDNITYLCCISDHYVRFSDRKLCLTLWQLKWCLRSNDKSVYSKFHIVSLVDFDINISVVLSHVINIGSVLYTLVTLRPSPFITDWMPDDFICLGSGCICGSICCNAACSSTPRHIRLSTGLFTGSSCSSTLLLNTRHWIGVGSYLL
jgi:hypothetical protein